MKVSHYFPTCIYMNSNKPLHRNKHYKFNNMYTLKISFELIFNLVEEVLSSFRFLFKMESMQVFQTNRGNTFTGSGSNVEPVFFSYVCCIVVKTVQSCSFTLTGFICGSVKALKPIWSTFFTYLMFLLQETAVFSHSHHVHIQNRACRDTFAQGLASQIRGTCSYECPLCATVSGLWGHIPLTMKNDCAKDAG